MEMAGKLRLTAKEIIDAEEGAEREHVRMAQRKGYGMVKVTVTLFPDWAKD